MASCSAQGPVAEGGNPNEISREHPMTTEGGMRENDRERFELARWLIGRKDRLLSSTANDCALILLTDGLLLLATTILVGRTPSAGLPFYTAADLLLVICAGATALLLFLSIFFASWAIAQPRVERRERAGDGNGRGISFFDSRDMARAFGKLKNFEEAFRAATREEMIHHGLSELFSITSARYQQDQRHNLAILLLLISLIPFLVSVILLLVRSLW